MDNGHSTRKVENSLDFWKKLILKFPHNMRLFRKEFSWSFKEFAIGTATEFQQPQRLIGAHFFPLRTLFSMIKWSLQCRTKCWGYYYCHRLNINSLEYISHGWIEQILEIIPFFNGLKFEGWHKMLSIEILRHHWVEKYCRN